MPIIDKEFSIEPILKMIINFSIEIAKRVWYVICR